MKRILTLFLVSVFFGVAAQTSYISLDDALATAFEQNPAIRASEYAVRAAHRERQAAIGLFMPKVSIKGAYAHLNKDIKLNLNPMLTQFTPLLGDGLSALGLDLSYTLQHRNSAFLGGDIVVPLFAGGRVWTGNKMAKIGEERTQYQRQQLSAALISEVVERYFAVELARRGVAIREEVVVSVRQHLYDVTMLEKEGMAVASDRLYVEYRLAEAERELQRVELQLETAQRALQISLGEENEEILPSTPMFLLSKIEPLDYFLSMAELHNPQLGEMERVCELARMNLRLRRAEHFPEIAAMGGMLFCNHQLTPLVPRMAVGIGVNFKIFDGLNKEYKSAAARMELRRVEALEQKVEQDISLLVESQYNRVQTILSSISAVRRSEQFAEELLRSKQKAFREGMATATDVVDATLNLSHARFEMVQSAYDLDVALARLLEASGVSDMYMQYLGSAFAQSIF
jgi:outer membrane protein TolC